MRSLQPGLIAACALASSLSLAGEPKASGTPVAEAEQQVLDVDRAWADAEVKHDTAALRRVLDDRFVATFGAGKPYDKEGFIKAVVDEEPDTTASQELTDRMVRVDRDTAVIVETDTVRGTADGKPVQRRLSNHYGVYQARRPLGGAS
jgi:hypothetical protein